MTWNTPSILLALWLLPPLALLLVYAERKRRAAARSFVDANMVRRLMPDQGSIRPWIKGALLLCGLAMLIIAAAGPRFGVYYENVAQRGVDLFVCLDVSRSMLAEDTKPNRLERAKFDVRDLLGELKGDRVGLIAFAGKPAVRVPLTDDHGYFTMVLNELDTTSAPRGGSLIGDAIRKAVESMPDDKTRDHVIFLFTDGEDHESLPREAAHMAKAKGVKIFTIALGDAAEGARIPIRDENGRNLQYLQYEGKELWSEVDEGLLRDLASTTGGAFIRAGADKAYDLGAVYRNHLADLTRGELASEKRQQYRQQFQLFLCLGILMLMADAFIARTPRRNGDGRRHGFVANGDAAGTPHVPRKKTSTATIAGAAMLLLLCLSANANASTRGAYQKVDEALNEFEQQKYAGAMEKLQEAVDEAPEDLRIVFNQACVLAEQGKRAEAADLLRTVAAGEDAELAADCYYNLGCLDADEARELLGDEPVLVEKGERNTVQKLLQSAAEHFRACLDMKPDDQTPRKNLEVVQLTSRHLTDAWARRDRLDQYEAMELNQLIGHLESEQRELRRMSRQWRDTPPSITQRLEVADAADAQRGMIDAEEALKAKIPEALTASSPNAMGGQPGVAMPGAMPMQGGDPEAIQRKGRAMTAMAQHAMQSMREAADQLESNHVGESIPDQQSAVDRLDAMRVTMTPFAELVHQSVQKQEGLVNQVTAAVRPVEVPTLPDTTTAGGAESDARAGAIPTDLASPVTLPTGDASPAEAAAPAAETTTIRKTLDHENTGWEQDFITRWSSQLLEKARADLPGVQQQLAQLPPAAETPDTLPNDADPHASSAQNATGTPDPNQQRKQLEDMQAALEKAIQVCPRIEEAAHSASEHLAARDEETALPLQEESLRLLKEIEDLLPKDQQQQDQNQDQNQQQQNQDQQQNDNQQNQQQDQDDSSDDQQDQQQQQDQQSGEDQQEQQPRDQSQGGDEEEQKDEETDDQPGNQEDEQSSEDSGQQGDEQTDEQPSDSGSDDQRQSGESQAEAVDVQPGEEDGMSEEDVERLLRLIRQREREGREKQHEIEIRLQRPRDVKKDW